jgi:hypothetical protein
MVVLCSIFVPGFWMVLHHPKNERKKKQMLQIVIFILVILSFISTSNKFWMDLHIGKIKIFKPTQVDLDKS